MNCCDANGRCTNGSNCATRLVPGNAPLRFAPGVIEHTPRPAFGTREQRRELLRWAGYLVVAVVLTLAAIGAGSVVAYLSARWATGA